MVETFLVALGSLLIALYLQARKSAREIRRNRQSSGAGEWYSAILRGRT